MGWHDDFLNEAVRQDLGKSGIKVAETLEIQTAPTEWWRLISSASPATVRGFVQRREPLPLIDGGEVHLEGVNLSVPMSYPYTAFTSGLADMESPQIAWGSDGCKIIFTITRSGTNATLRVFNDVAEAEWTAEVPPYDPPEKRHGPWGYFDYVNNRLLVRRHSGSGTTRRYTVETWDPYGVKNSTSSLTTGTHMLTTVYQFRSFPEEPTKVYSVFWSSGGIPKVKGTTVTLGEDPITQSVSILCSDSGAVSITDFENVTWDSNLPKIHLFYFRQHASVAMAWWDETANRIKYVLEVDDWAVTYTMPDIFTSNPQTVVGIGNFVSEVDGEFLVAYSRQSGAGVFITPPGYSFPANLTILGACSGAGETDILIFGNVGSNLYSWSLDLSDMSLTPNGVVWSSWSQVSSTGAPVTLGKSGNRICIMFHHPNQFKSYNRYLTINYLPVLMVYDTENHVVEWEYSQFQTDLPQHTSNKAYAFSNIFVTPDDHLLFVSFSYNFSSRTHRVSGMSLVECFDCADVTAFRAILNGRKRSTSTPTLPSDSTCFFGIQSSVSVGVTPDYWVLPILRYQFNSSTGTLYYLHIARNNYYLHTDAPSLSVSMGVNGGYISQRVTDTSQSFMKMLNRYVQDGEFLGTETDRDYRWWSYCDGHNSWKQTYLSYPIARSAFTTDSHGVTDYTRYFQVATDTLNQAMSYAWKPETGTIAYQGGTISPGGTGRMYATFSAGFNLRHLFVDMWNDVALAIGSVDGNSLPYYRMTAKGARPYEIRAYHVDTGELYNFILDRTLFGGAQYFLPKGSELAFRDLSGNLHLFSTGVSLDAWIPESGGEGPGLPSVVYDYEDMGFIPYPFAREGIRAELSNVSKTTQVTLPDTQDHFIRELLSSGLDPRGCRCILRRIFPDHAEDEGGSIILLDGYIQDWAYSPDKQGIIFTVSRTLLDVNNAFPKRLMNMGCGHVFRGARCQYAGVTGLCPKTKAFCTSLGNVNQFGGFPWVAARQRRVMWR